MKTLFLLMKKTRAMKFKVRIFYHLQNLFWGVFGLGGFVRGDLSGGVMSGVFCPITPVVTAFGAISTPFPRFF